MKNHPYVNISAPNSHKMNSKGNMLVTSIFVLFIFISALSILTFCITHTRIVRFRTAKLTEIDRLQQALTYYIHTFREAVFLKKLQNYINPEIDFFNKTNFPPRTIDNRYCVTPNFSSVTYPKIGYKNTRCIVTMNATIQGLPYLMRSEAIIDFLSGNIPLFLIPLFINPGTGDNLPSADEYLTANKIVNKSGKNIIVDNIPTQINSTQWIIDTLNISTTLLNWKLIREKIGMPLSEDPVPEGIYLVKEPGIIESILIQGDIDQMTFSIDDVLGLQKIRITRNFKTSEIVYKPGSLYVMWEGNILNNYRFKEKLIVNGNIDTIAQEGNAFLENSDITLFASGKAIIRTSLQTKFHNIDVIPTVETNLKIINAKDSLFKAGASSPGITVDTQNDTTLRASIITTGKFNNTGSQLNLLGSLYCQGVENLGAITITYQSPSLETNNDFSTLDFKYIDQFVVHFIEEVCDGDE